jgi:2-isopropylmalate synthase
MARIQIYDTTLRDGSQGEGINFSLQDKLLITRRLDDLGVDFIEGGYPLSNPKDFEYFQQVRKIPLKNARIAAFGMTRRKNVKPQNDTCLKALLDSQAPVITLVGKTWDLHVREVVGTTLEENLHMIADSVAYCKGQGREVLFDAEHFFVGFKHNPDYALETLRAARKAGATVLILCDTNGGTLPEEIAERVRRVRKVCRGSTSASIATMIAMWRWPTPWPQSPRAPATFRGRSLASASAAATSIWSASSPTWA